MVPGVKTGHSGVVSAIIWQEREREREREREGGREREEGGRENLMCALVSYV